jgi:hypothetical protein
MPSEPSITNALAQTATNFRYAWLGCTWLGIVPKIDADYIGFKLEKWTARHFAIISRKHNVKEP